MKITKKICREVNIFNEWDYAIKGTHPYLYYSPQETGRGGHPAHWRVSQSGVKFSEHWYDHGTMPFMLWNREDRKPKFEEAVAWMKNRFGYDEIVKTPMGSWMEKSFVEQRNKEIEEKYKALKSQGA